jgi:hypothetical protein
MLREAQALLHIDLAHHPQVDEREYARFEVDEEVPGVRVGVEEAVDGQLLDERPERVAGDLLAVQTGLLERLHVADLDAADELLGDHRGRRELCVDCGDMHAGEVRHVLGEAEGVVGLAAVVELLEHAGGELLEHADEVQRAHRLGPGRDDAGSVLHDAEIGAYHL